MVNQEKRLHDGIHQSQASRTVRGGGAHPRGGVMAVDAAGLGAVAVQELLARGDVREMRRVVARLRKWLGGAYELVGELEQVIVELEEPRR